MAKNKKSPLHGTPYVTEVGSKIKKAYIKSNPSWQRSFGYDSEGNKIGALDMPKTSGPKKLSPGGGVIKPTITNEGFKIPGVKSDDRPAYERPGTGSTKVDKPKTVETSSNKNTSTKPAAKPITSSDSGDRSGGYLKNTKNFSLGVDLSMPKSKMQTTVTNARSANTDLISGRMSRRDKIAARQSRKTARVRERVGNQIERIKGRQERAGVRAGAKMARRDKGANVGKMESQRKLDAFEKSMDSPKATIKKSSAGNITGAGKIGDSKSMPSLRTPKSNQTVAKPSIKLNTSKQTSKVIDDSRIKQGAKKASGGGKVSADTYKSLTGFNKMTSKPGSSGGMQRGMAKSSTSIKPPASGPRAKTVKVESGPSERTKFIMNTYNNIRK
jgi:hypothetical protein